MTLKVFKQIDRIHICTLAELAAQAVATDGTGAAPEALAQYMELLEVLTQLRQAETRPQARAAIMTKASLKLGGNGGWAAASATIAVARAALHT